MSTKQRPADPDPRTDNHTITHKPNRTEDNAQGDGGLQRICGGWGAQNEGCSSRSGSSLTTLQLSESSGITHV